MKRVRRGLLLRQWQRKSFVEFGVDKGWDYVGPLHVKFLHRPSRRRSAGKLVPTHQRVVMEWQADRRWTENA